MKLRLALSALTVAAVAATTPMLANAQPVNGGKAVASTPVPNPPETTTTTRHKVTHHTKHKVSHRRHKAASASHRKTVSAASLNGATSKSSTATSTATTKK
jgi:hypothetical protein